MQKFNRPTIQHHFDHAAITYDEAAVLQKQIADHLDERLGLMVQKPNRILDLGAGTGILTQKILARYPDAEVYAVDLAYGMLQQAKKQNSSPSWQQLKRQLGLKKNALHYINADGYCLPFADGSLDMIVSNLMLQWCDDLESIFNELRRVLKPEGLILFTTFGPDTLKELRQAWQAVDHQPHVNHFIDMHDIGDILIHCGFGQPVMDAEIFTLTYEKPIGVLKDLKAIGATNAQTQQHKGLMGKQRFTKMLTAYEQFEQAGRVPATYEIVHGHAWAAQEIMKGPHRNKSGVVEISLEAFAKQTKSL